MTFEDIQPSNNKAEYARLKHPTPPAQPEDAAFLRQVIKQELSRAYYNGLDHKGWSTFEEESAVTPIMNLVREHERQAVQDARIELLEEVLSADDSGDFISQMAHAVGVVGRKYQELQATQPPAADTTKQGEGESDE